MALLEIRGLRKTYPTGERALDGVDVSVDAKQVVAILGLSGSGKSTLLRCINRLVEPDEGVGGARRHRRHVARPSGDAPHAATHGHDLPGIQSRRAADGARERALRPPGVHFHVAGGHARLPPPRHRARTASVPSRGADRPRSQARGSVERRSAPAGGDCEGIDTGSQDPPRRRTDVEPGTRRSGRRSWTS